MKHGWRGLSGGYKNQHQLPEQNSNIITSSRRTTDVGPNALIVRVGLTAPLPSHAPHPTASHYQPSPLATPGECQERCSWVLVVLTSSLEVDAPRRLLLLRSVPSSREQQWQPGPLAASEPSAITPTQLNRPPSPNSPQRRIHHPPGPSYPVQHMLPNLSHDMTPARILTTNPSCLSSLRCCRRDISSVPRGIVLTRMVCGERLAAECLLEQTRARFPFTAR